MKINKNHIKNFWIERSKKIETLSIESISNLENDSELVDLKVNTEYEKILSILSLTKKTDILDLGAGPGQWAFRFAPIVNSIFAVEYIEEFCKIGKSIALKKNIKNITYLCCPVTEFKIKKKFNVIFISGLLLYLSDREIKKLLNNLKNYMYNNSLIFLRDSISILKDEFVLINKKSIALNQYYSAKYRTKNQLISLFRNYGYNLDYYDQFFEEGNILNKFPETRLCAFVFKYNNIVVNE